MEAEETEDAGAGMAARKYYEIDLLRSTDIPAPANLRESAKKITQICWRRNVCTTK